jgi:methyl-accepting chemotaxis protein
MGLFGSNTKKLIQEFRRKSEHYSNDLSREIREMLDDLKSDYEETSEVLPEFSAFIIELSQRVEKQDAQKLEEFVKRIAKVNRSARKGVDAMWELSNNQRKLTAENLRDVDALQYQH